MVILVKFCSKELCTIQFRITQSQLVKQLSGRYQNEKRNSWLCKSILETHTGISLMTEKEMNECHQVHPL